MDYLAERLKTPTVLEDHEQRMVVYSSHSAPVDEVRRDSILRRETRQEVKDWFRQFGIVQARDPLRIPSHPELGILGRLCAPVRFRGRLMGFLFLIDDDQRLTAADIAVVQEVQRHAALLLSEEELSERLRASSLSHLLAPAAELRQAAARQLIDEGLAAADAIHVAVCLRLADDTVPDLPELIREALWELGRRRGPACPLRTVRRDHGVLLVEVSEPDGDGAALSAAEEARGLLSKHLGTAGVAPRAGGSHRVIAGIGDPQPALTSAAISYREAVLAARVAAAVPSVGEVARWRDLGAFRALVQLPPGEAGGSCLDPRLITLLRAEPGLLRTVESYLDSGGDAKQTSERLHLHRATLYYRLGKAERLTGADLRDGNDRLALHLGLKLARLTGQYPAEADGSGSPAVCTPDTRPA